MKNNPYKDLPPLECRPDGSLYRMTPAQRKRASALIRRECCCCEDGNCIALDDGDTCTCPQTVSFSVCCKWFRWAVLPLDGALEAEIFRDKDLKRCAVCGGVFVPKSNRAKYCPGCAARVHRRQKTESERKRRSCCGQLGAKKALIYQASQAPNRGGWYKLSPTPENRLLTVHKTRYDKHDLHSSAGTGVQLHPAPQFPL